MTEITEIAAEIIEILAAIKYIDNLIVIIDLKNITISAKKRATTYKNI